MSIDVGLMERVGMRPYERILCGNLSNGERFETYAIPAKKGSAAIVLNGATAFRGKVGDLLTIMSFAEVEESLAAQWKPQMVVLGMGNVVSGPSVHVSRG